MAINGTVQMAGPIAPTNEADVYPTQLPKYGKGGFRTVASISERDNIPSPRREIGMVVYVSANDTYYKLVDPNTNSYVEWQLGTPTNLPGRIWYDTIAMTNLTYPTTLAIVRNLAQRRAAYINENWSYLISRLKCVINEQDLQFNTQEELISWLNNNIPHGDTSFSQEINIHFYDEIDNSIPAISKMYGFNRFYSMLVGKGNYRNNINNVCTDCHSASAKTIMWEVSKELIVDGSGIPFMVSANIRDYGMWEAEGGLAQIWIGGKERNKYALPKGDKSYNAKIVITHSNNRKVCNPNWEGIYAAPSGEYRLGLPRLAIMNFLGNGPGVLIQNLHYNILTPAISSADNRRGSELLLDSNTTAVVVYPVIKIETDGHFEYNDTDYAMYVKPAGIDQVHINWFDTSKYELEAYFENKNRSKAVVVAVSESQFLNVNQRRDTIVLNKGAFLHSSFQELRPKCHDVPWQVRFRLRDKTTKRVGVLSNSKIITTMGGMLPIKFIVE